jgi:hypothetical protein
MSKRICNYAEKDCLSCATAFKPTSGSQLYCSPCRGDGPKKSAAKYRTKNPQNTEFTRAYNREWYAKNNKAVRAKNKHYDDIRRTKRREELNDLKKVPCAECGKRFDPVAMDFDHVRGKKSSTIGKGSLDKNWDLVLEEIKKCEVVCSNCHRIRTKQRRTNKLGL